MCAEHEVGRARRGGAVSTDGGREGRLSKSRLQNDS